MKKKQKPRGLKMPQWHWIGIECLQVLYYDIYRARDRLCDELESCLWLPCISFPSFSIIIAWKWEYQKRDGYALLLRDVSTYLLFWATITQKETDQDQSVIGKFQS